MTFGVLTIQLHARRSLITSARQILFQNALWRLEIDKSPYFLLADNRELSQNMHQEIPVCRLAGIPITDCPWKLTGFSLLKITLVGI